MIVHLSSTFTLRRCGSTAGRQLQYFLSPLAVTTRDDTRLKTRSAETKRETLRNRFRGETKREAREKQKAKASATILAHSLDRMCSEHCEVEVSFVIQSPPQELSGLSG